MRHIGLTWVPLLVTLLAGAAQAQRVGSSSFRVGAASSAAPSAADEARAADQKRIEASPWRVQPPKQPDFAVKASVTEPRAEQPATPATSTVARRSPAAEANAWTALRTPLPRADVPVARRKPK